MLLRTLLAATLACTAAHAQVIPSEPDGATVVRAGSNITTSWAIDKSGTWNNLTIQLMTGSNLQMVPLETVVTGLDGTKETTFSFVAPEVEPYSKVYFLQFTNGLNPTNVQWTTRFTIASADGATVPPPQNETIADGSIVGWGIGSIVGAPAPVVPSGVPSGILAASSAAPSSAGPSAPLSVSLSPSAAPSASGSGSARASVSASASASASASPKPTSAASRAAPALAALALAAAAAAVLA
ncbi:hypothetical protein Q8F55_003187 [Vanrija albida]|uniref:Yeast cell wall synthesis Kre9/Knh1-like N-terminal domain-containing protein n=1 Tax=Vanrija albida TaxID=181172 RepID=A0ABR3QCE9_9TREE